MDYAIIGGGPVGLAAALLLAKQGINCTVYEGRTEIPDNPKESYPIGVNARGLFTAKEISSLLEERIKSTGKIVDSWQIYGGNRRVALQPSGVVYGTSRSKVNLVLYEECLKSNRISIKFGHKLSGIDLQARTLTFQTPSGQIVVDASKSRVIAADGLYSMVRRCMDKHVSSFKSVMTTWTFEFRVLFAPVGKMLPEIDPKVHYIFSGFYAATLDNRGEQQWTLVTGTRDHSPPAMRELLLSKDPSPKNIAKLKETIKKVSPLMYPFFEANDDELHEYFGRRSFRGALVKCNRLNHDEWIVLLGDAAHSVIPPTGEGINSGLEDCYLLAQCVKNDPQHAFQAFNDQRQPDVTALLEYAEYLNQEPLFPGEKVARVMFMIIEGGRKSSISSMLFGPASQERTPYRDIVGLWKRRRRVILPLCRAIAYPFGLVYFLLKLPLMLFQSLTKGKVAPVDTELKLTV